MKKQIDNIEYIKSLNNYMQDVKEMVADWLIDLEHGKVNKVILCMQDYINDGDNADEK